MIKHSSSRLIVALLVLISATAVTVYCAMKGEYEIIALSLPFIVWSVIECVRIYNSIIIRVKFMFDAIENDDLTFRFRDTGMISPQDKLLNRSLNRIKELVSNVKNEVKEREHFYEIILDRVSTGIIIMNDTGIIYTVNDAALSLLRISRLTHINQTGYISVEIPDKFISLTEGSNDSIKFYDEVSEISINLSATYVDTPKGRMKVILLTDIAGQLEETEMESWTRLSRVLTHEIMNSLAPINSLSQALITTDDETIRQQGLEIINSTSTGLMKFVENYKNLTRVPKPILELIEIESFVRERVSLWDKNLKTEILAQDLVINADRGLISQVVTNLIKNGSEATAETEGEVWIRTGRTSRGKIYIDVCNNGVPIDDEVLKNIFIPFFSTKNGSSGIGLSLSRQIMQLHGGTLTVSTRPHTTFRMEFPLTS